MAIDKTKFRTIAPGPTSAVVIDSVDAGGISPDGIKLRGGLDVLELRPGQSLAPLVRLVKEAKDIAVEFTLWELTLENWAKIANTYTAVANGVLTGDVQRVIQEHTLTINLTLSDGSTWVFEATVQFDPKWEITAKIDEEGKLPVVAWLIPDIDNNYKFFELTETAAAGGALTMPSSVPTDGASNVVVTEPLTWTFSRAILPSTIEDNIKVVKTSDGSKVAGSFAYNATLFKVTFTPTGSLTAGTVYNTVVDKRLRPATGPTLAADVLTNFTTAS